MAGSTCPERATAQCTAAAARPPFFIHQLAVDVPRTTVVMETEPPSFLCDEMLGRLARYLRAAGYDTALASGGAADREVVALARREHRCLLTCDRGIAEHKAARGIAVILPRSPLDALALELASTLHVHWLR